MHGHLSHAGYDVINHFRSTFIEVPKIWPKMVPPTALDRIKVALRLAWRYRLVGFLLLYVMTCVRRCSRVFVAVVVV